MLPLHMRFGALGLVLLSVMGCTSYRPRAVAPSAKPSELSSPVTIPEVNAACVPPAGWIMRPIEQSRNHAQALWVSPTGSTAYGVIRLSYPLPLGDETVLWFFMREMRNREGEANLISKQRDVELAGLRFVAEGGKYLIRAKLQTAGFRGWVVYAGTLRDRDIQPNELRLAELARENTETGVDANPPSARP